MQIDEIETVTYPITTNVTNVPSTLPPILNTLSDKTLANTVNDCPSMKAPRPDGIQNWVWVSVWPVVKSLSFLLKMITIHRIIPQNWKNVRTFMPPKPGKADYTAPLVYGPISRLNTISKVFEEHLTTHLSDQFKTNHL